MDEIDVKEEPLPIEGLCSSPLFHQPGVPNSNLYLIYAFYISDVYIKEEPHDMEFNSSDDGQYQQSLINIK
jgi:hypothetical protein